MQEKNTYSCLWTNIMLLFNAKIRSHQMDRKNLKKNVAIITSNRLCERFF